MPNDYFRFKHFTVRQEMCAMKVGTDATLLGAWAQLPPPDSACAKVLDIGTGTGIIAMMMSQRYPEASVTGIDIDSNAALQAADNAASSPFAGRIGIVCQAVQEFCGGPYDAIVCNPPYFTDSLECPDPKRTLSRHTAALSFDELAANAFRLLAAGGEFSVIIPTDQLRGMEAAAAIAGLFEKRRCNVRTKAGKAPKRTMLAYSKHPEPTLQVEEFTINDATHRRLTADFYL